MAATCGCGAVVPTSAQWCSLCHRPAADPRFVPAGAEPVRDAVPAAPARPSRTVGRFAATEVTFGLRGRLVMTVLVFLPFWFFLKNLVTGGWVGVIILAMVGLPWALRDIWRSSDRL